MDLRHLINVHIASLVVLAAMLFGIGQPSVVLPLVMLAAAVLAIRYSHMQSRFQASRLTVNIAIFIIAITSGWRLVQAHGTLEVIVVAHAVAALQIVLMFERETPRSRWDLISLSLLMVFCSTSFIHGPLWGVLLVVFFFFAFSTLALLLAEHEQIAVRASQLQADSAAREITSTRTRTNWLRLLGIAVATLIVGPLALFLRFGEGSRRRGGKRSSGEADSSRRWPLLGQRPSVPASAASALDSSFSGREFRWRMGRITLVSILVSLLIFCIAPRFGRVEFRMPQLSDVGWREGAMPRRRRTGYSDRVKLGELGTTSEDQRVVLEAKFADLQTGEYYAINRGIYLRGAIKTHYVEGHWDFHDYGPYMQINRSSGNPLVRQKITVKPLGRRDLFCVWPFVHFDDDQPIRFDVRGERLYRPNGLADRAVTYELATTAFDSGVQAELVPVEQSFARDSLLRWPSASFPTLQKTAQQWIADTGLPADDTMGRARALEEGLRQRGSFAYSLEEPQRDPMLDPIEDFVSKNQQGTCEFFASALALMLRSQGIPSRLVVGYRTEVFNSVSQSYLVRQYHAHAWVEAYIPPEHLPVTDRPKNHTDWSQGAWLRLDPTPLRSMPNPTFVQRMGNVLEWFRAVWRDHVLGMDGTQQNAAIYRPLVERVQALALQLADPEQWRDFRLVQLWELNSTVIFRGWLAGLGLALCVVLVRFRWQPATRRGRLRRLFGGASHEHIGRTEVEFYEEFEAILARHGQVRRTTQTQREFAADAGRRIAERTGEQEFAQLAMEIADTFYYVRFGQLELDSRRARTVEDALSQIKRAGSRQRQKSSPTAGKSCP